MAFTEEKEAGKNESKQSNNTDEILKIISNSESKRLDLSRRHIEDVPIEMKSLRKLEFLYLEGNSLTCLPDDFFTCLIQLKWLDLRNNHLTHLPVTIGESRCLRSLLLEDNKIKRLPLELGFVQSLTGLHLAGNPLEFPPQSIVEQGTQVLLAFLRDEWLKMQKEIDDHSECDEADKLEDNTVDEGKERAQRNTSALKLPPINANVGCIQSETNARKIKGSSGTETGKESIPNLLRKQKSLSNEISRRKSPLKDASDHLEKGEKTENRKESASEGKADEASSRVNGKSSKKKQPKHKKKSKNVREPVTIMTAVVSESGTVKMSYRAEAKEESWNNEGDNQREDENRSEKITKIMDEEIGKLKKARESVAITESQKQKNQMKFAASDLSINDMVVMKVPGEHFIPGQPCLGRIVSLPDAVGVLLVHYYSGSFDGIWKPMMSRSSPYLRRIPLSKILYKFELDANGRMTEEIIEKVKKAIETEH